MLLDAAVLTIIVGLIGGGRLGRLKNLDLRAPAVFIAAAAVQIGILVLGASGVSAAVLLGGPVHILTYLLLLVGLWLNRHLWGVRIAALGVFLNFLVIAANGGSMPVDRALAAVPPGRQFVVSYVADGARYWADPTYDSTPLWEGVEVGPTLGHLFGLIPSRAEVRRALESAAAETIPTLVVLGKRDYAIPHTTWTRSPSDRAFTETAWPFTLVPLVESRSRIVQLSPDFPIVQ